ncbi:MAG: efflux RND transporter permease subunit [Clostridia bacterium]|nr:efflux RND transporter permease subunit [Clostridia bacterium]
MKAFGRGVVKCRVVILILSLALLVPSAMGYLATRVNYDILSYLPGDIETMVGQQILEEEFGTGAFSMVVVEDMAYKDVAKLKEAIEGVDHVKKVIWYDSFMDLSVPAEMLPDKVREAFDDGTATMMAVLFDTTMSADETMDAIEEMREITQHQCLISGMSAVVTDTKNLAAQETPIYVLIAVALCTLVLGVTMDSFLAPILFLLSIGIAVVYNLGSNLFLGQISYITQALAAVLQLGVTIDYSIFLWHSYEEQCERNGGDKKDAMACAIAETMSSVVGSSITTVAGFVALCFMSFTLGMDMGVVMAKGVVIGVICCVTVLPSMILIFDKAIQKTKHRPLLPDLQFSEKLMKHPLIIFLVFLILWVPAVYGNNHTDVYYNLDSSLPESLDSITANARLSEHFNMGATHMLLVDASLPSKDVSAMVERMEAVDGVKSVLGIDALMGPAFPREWIPEKLKGELMNENWQLMLITSEYAVASDEVNAQCEALTGILKEYDQKGMLIGEAPCTKDLIEITDTDFKMVNSVSIGMIALIIMLVFRSLSLPVLLVLVIEFAINVNMGIPFYTGTTLPFIASVVIGTIQLGATVDYAILMTNRYKAGRRMGVGKKQAVMDAHNASVRSVFVSAISFFAATFGVGLYSGIDMISSLCMLMARGALISMVVVLTVLPTVLYLFDGLITHTSIGFLPKKKKEGI